MTHSTALRPFEALTSPQALEEVMVSDRKESNP